MGQLRLYAGFAALLQLIAVSGARADSVSDFYKSTPLRLIIGAFAGDEYDAIGRFVGSNLGKHIPGNPKIIVENMGGASSRIAANYAYTLAPKDGSALFEFIQTVPLNQALDEAGIRYDAVQFNWIGTPITPIDVFVVWSATGIKTMRDATQIAASIGATSEAAQNYIYPQLANQLLGTKFRIVTGYEGGNGINLAMERNEVQGRGAFPWLLLKATRPDWLKDNRLSILASMSLKSPPDLPNVPSLVDLTQNGDVRGVFELMEMTAEVARPFAMPQGTPPDRVEAVRHAFDEMVKDPDFIADATAIKQVVAPRSGAELAELVRRIVTVPPATIQRFRSALAAKQ